MALCWYSCPCIIPTFGLVQVLVFADTNLRRSHFCLSNIPGQVKNDSIWNALWICLVWILQLMVCAFNLDVVVDSRTPGHIHSSFISHDISHLKYILVVPHFLSLLMLNMYPVSLNIEVFFDNTLQCTEFVLIVIFTFLFVFWYVCLYSPVFRRARIVLWSFRGTEWIFEMICFCLEQVRISTENQGEENAYLVKEGGVLLCYCCYKTHVYLQNLLTGIKVVHFQKSY